MAARVHLVRHESCGRQRSLVALEWTEAVTLVAESYVPDEVYERVKRHFSEQEVIDLTLAITNTKVWNRLNVASAAWPGTTVEACTSPPSSTSASRSRNQLGPFSISPSSGIHVNTRTGQL